MALFATLIGLFAPAFQAPAHAASSADNLCGVTFSGPGTFEPVNGPSPTNGVWKGNPYVDIGKWGDKFTLSAPVAAGYIVWASTNLSIPDSCVAGNQAWVDMPNGFHVRGANLTDLTDSAGNSIAKVTLETRPGSSRSDTRLVFTLTNYVDSHTGASASYRFQYQEGRDIGVQPDSTVTVSMSSSDGTQFNPITWHFNGNTWWTGSAGGGWTGDATHPDGQVEVRSYPSFTGTDDVDMIFTAGPGYDWDCNSASNDNNATNLGIGLVDIGSTANSAPTAANLLDPSKYTLTCDEGTVRIHMPASSWTSADAQSGQVLLVKIRRVANGDMSWQPSGGVWGFVTIKQTGNPDLTDYRWISIAPGQTATGAGAELKESHTSAPTLNASTQCGVRDTVTTGSDEGVTYQVTVSADGNTATVTARAKAGYYIPSSQTTRWTLTIPAAKPCPSSITYDAGDPQNGFVGDEVVVHGETPTRTGYTFTGWEDCVTHEAVAPGSTLTLPEGGLKLCSVWKADPAKIVYDPNGGKGTTPATTGVTDQKVTVADGKFTRDGYTFTGWSTAKSGGTPVAVGSSMTLAPGDTTLHAVWSADPAALNYDANGGAGTTPATTGVTDQKVTVAEGAFTRDGYTFTGWKDKDGNPVLAGSTVTLKPGTQTLYAIWKADPAKIVYDANGGKGAVPATTGGTDQKVTVADGKFTRDGYTFTGWSTKAEGGEKVQAGSTVTLKPGTQTLYAIWKANPAAVTYDPNGGEGEIEPTQGVTGGSVTVANGTFTRTGYTFTGWKACDGETTYQPGQGLTLPAGGVKLCAVWSADPAHLVYDPNGGQGVMDEVAGVTDQEITLADSAFTRAGYTFTGWSTKADGGDLMGAGETFTLPAGDTVVYATWKADAAQITYNPNGGAGSIDPTTGVTDEKVKVTDHTFTRDGYSFTGWQVCGKTDADTLKAGDEVTLPADGLSLCAQWQETPEPVALAKTGTAITGLTVATLLLIGTGTALIASKRRA